MGVELPHSGFLGDGKSKVLQYLTMVTTKPRAFKCFMGKCQNNIGTFFCWQLFRCVKNDKTVPDG